MYADNVAKVTNQRYRHITASDVSSDVDADRSGVHITKLDIYIGYTEDILKLCTRIADLPSLDRAILGLEVSNMYVRLTPLQLLRTDETTAITPSKHGPQPRGPISSPRESPRGQSLACKPWPNVFATRHTSISIPSWSVSNSHP